MFRILQYLEYTLYGIILVIVILMMFIIFSQKNYYVENYQDSVVMVTNGHSKGTGFHIGNGYIITAAHVVANPSEYQIKTQNNDLYDVDIIETFEEYDVAVLKINVIPSYLTDAKMTCKEPTVGTEIHSIGNPQNLEFTYVWGTVSYSRIDDLFDKIKRVFVVDMTTVPGQSGAPLFNEYGKVEGMISAVMVHPFNGRFPNIVGYGYGIPSNVICDLAGEYYGK